MIFYGVLFLTIFDIVLGQQLPSYNRGAQVVEGGGGE